VLSPSIIRVPTLSPLTVPNVWPPPLKVLVEEGPPNISSIMVEEPALTVKLEAVKSAFPSSISRVDVPNVNVFASVPSVTKPPQLIVVEPLVSSVPALKTILCKKSWPIDPVIAHSPPTPSKMTAGGVPKLPLVLMSIV
jgi:hypothetical protein